MNQVLTTTRTPMRTDDEAESAPSALPPSAWRGTQRTPVARAPFDVVAVVAVAAVALYSLIWLYCRSFYHQLGADVSDIGGGYSLLATRVVIVPLYAVAVTVLAVLGAATAAALGFYYCYLSWFGLVVLQRYLKALPPRLEASADDSRPAALLAIGLSVIGVPLLFVPLLVAAAVLAGLVHHGPAAGVVTVVLIGSEVVAWFLARRWNAGHDRRPDSIALHPVRTAGRLHRWHRAHAGGIALVVRRQLPLRRQVTIGVLLYLLAALGLWATGVHDGHRAALGHEPGVLSSALLPTGPRPVCVVNAQSPQPEQCGRPAILLGDNQGTYVLYVRSPQPGSCVPWIVSNTSVELFGITRWGESLGCAPSP
jgi:hypothetical protein